VRFQVFTAVIIKAMIALMMEAEHTSETTAFFTTLHGAISQTDEPGSSVSIVSGYGLDDRAIDVRSPAGTKNFSYSFSVSRPALGPTQPPVQWVPLVLSPGLKRGRGVTLITHPYLVPRSRMIRSYISSPPSAFMACSGTALALYRRWLSYACSNKAL
jgi:hypothetical protein